MSDDPKSPPSDVKRSGEASPASSEAKPPGDDSPTNTVGEGETNKEAKKAEAVEPEPPAAKRAEKPKVDVAASPAKRAPAAKPAAAKSDDEAAKVRRPGQAPAEKEQSSTEGRRGRASGESAGVLVVVAGALIVGNLAFKAFPVRVDTTREERFSLSKKGTAHLLSTLSKPLKIVVYAPEGLATIDAFVRDLRDLLSEYVRYGDGKVTFEVIVPDKLEGEQRAKAEADATEAGLEKQMIGENTGSGGSKATIGQGFLGMVMTYGGEKATLDQKDGFSDRSPMGLEFLISTKIRELRDKEDHLERHIGFLQGHKEKGYQEYSQIFTRYFPYYKLDSVDLSKGEKPVDDKLDGLIIGTPEEEISEKELRRIDQFLMKGKAVAVFANTVHFKENDATMNVTFSGMGLDKLLTGYGIDFKNELLIDKQQFWTPVLMLPQGLGVPADPYVPILYADGSRTATFDNKFAPFFRLPQVAVPFPTEITIDKGRAGGDAVKVETVFKTSPTIVTVQGTSISVNPDPQKLGNGATGEKEEKRSAIIGVSLQGPIKSAFPGGGDGIEAPANASANTRLFVLSSGAFFTNVFQDAGKSPFGNMMPGMDPNMGADKQLMQYAQMYQKPRISTFLVTKQTCDWISQDTDLLSVGAKLLGEPELTYRNVPVPTPAPDEKMDSDSYKKKKQQWHDQIVAEQHFTQWGSIAIGPCVLALLGLWRWWSRNARRASVKI